MLMVSPPLKIMRNLTLLSVLGSALVACGGGGGSDAVDPRTQGGGSTTDPAAAVVVMGNGTGTDFVQNQAKATETSLQAGASTEISVNVVDSNNSNIAVTDVHSITFASDCASNGLSSFSATEVSTVSGLASTTYTAAGCSGNDVVTASVTINAVIHTAPVTLTIESDQVLGVEFVSVTPSQLSLAGLGADETAVLTFRLVGEQSAPIIGEEVRFTTSSTVGGIRLAEGSDTDVTDSQGLVTTVLQSGTISTSVEVIAEHVSTGITASSGDITISTGIPVADRFSLSLDKHNPHAWNVDGVVINFSVIASDFFGNAVPDGTRVSFASTEAGNIDDSCLLVDGQCSDVKWISANPGPSNGQVTILAHTTGAEAFDDLNGNNVFDAGDNFNVSGDQDLAEAYIDENENGFYDLGEFFVDANENTVRDLADGEWNGPCMSGIDPSALCPANVPTSVTIARTFTFTMSSSDVVFFNQGNFGAAGGIINLPGFGLSNTISNLVLSDINGNSLPGGTQISFTVEAVSGKVKLAGNTAFEVPTDTISANGPYSINLVPEETGTGILTMTVKIDGVLDQIFIWNLTF